jgi:hypothetical protein
MRIRDPVPLWPWPRDGKIRIRGSGINIPDPQHSAAAFKQNSDHHTVAQIYKKVKTENHAFQCCHCLTMDGQWRRRSYPVTGRWRRRQHEATLMPHQVGLGVEALPALRAHELQVAGVQPLVGFPVRQLQPNQSINLPN